MKTRRVSSARVIVWTAALAELRRNRRAVAYVGLILLAAIACSNLISGTPRWEAGFLTGVAGAAFVGLVLWMAWVPSGLAHRGMGVLAEDWTTEMLRKSPGILAVIPSLGFAGTDVDHVVVAAAGVIAVETKWNSRCPTEQVIMQAAQQAADGGRRVRLNLRRTELPVELFSSALILWGPYEKKIAPRTVTTGKGPVVVMSGTLAAPWLETLRRGTVGIDYGEDLKREIDALATARDASGTPIGPVLRWLARTK